MTRLRLILIAVALSIAGVVAVLWVTGPQPNQRQIVVPAKTPFTKGRFLAYAQPWGGEQVWWTRLWTPHADSLAINVGRFPAGTSASWRWPPLIAANGPGVWAYDHVAFGNYDGGEPEVSVPPQRVSDLRDLRQAFAWRIEDGVGEANVLTEFYLRSSRTNVDAKVLEIGFFLHAPDSTKRFVRGAKRQLGFFTDADARRWQVSIEDRFCMFLLARDGDLTSATIDMLPAIRWLQAKRLIKGDEWFSGLAIGVEPVRGIGRFHLDRWAVALR